MRSCKDEKNAAVYVERSQASKRISRITRRGVLIETREPRSVTQGRFEHSVDTKGPEDDRLGFPSGDYLDEDATVKAAGVLNRSPHLHE